jgi:transposase
VARPQKKWLRQKRTILFVDEAGFYLLPHVVRTWSRRGHRPVLRERGSKRHDHLSAMAGVTLNGALYMFSQEEAFNSSGVVGFLEHLLWHISGKLGIIWDGAGIHSSEEVRTFLREGGAKRIELVRLPTYAPELNPVEGVWSYMKEGSFLRNFSCHDLTQLKNLLATAAGALQSQPPLVRAFFGQAGCY